MRSAEIPANEAARLIKLAEYGVLANFIASRQLGPASRLVRSA